MAMFFDLAGEELKHLAYGSIPTRDFDSRISGQDGKNVELSHRHAVVKSKTLKKANNRKMELESKWKAPIHCVQNI
jgi:2-oxoglutarate dehydrogenase complex dehydrogenase (E1) component-like enzyme